MLNYSYKIIYFYWCIFNNNIYISNILFKFLNHKLLINISNNKIQKLKYMYKYN